MTVMLVFIALFLISMYYGYNHSYEMDIVFEIKRLSNPYFHLGMSFEKEYEEEGQVVETFILGLFFVNLVIVFYKNNA